MLPDEYTKWYAKIESLDASVLILSEENLALKDLIDGLKSRIDDLEDRLENTCQSLGDSIEETKASLNARLDRSDDASRELERRMGNCEDDIRRRA